LYLEEFEDTKLKGTDNTVAKRKRKKRQRKIYKTLHI